MRVLIADGGRKAAVFRGQADDCVCRSIAIAGQLPYREVYDLINAYGKQERGVHTVIRGKSSARSGVYKDTQRAVLEHLGWPWTPTMRIGSGCRVHHWL